VAARSTDHVINFLPGSTGMYQLRLIEMRMSCNVSMDNSAPMEIWMANQLSAGRYHMPDDNFKFQNPRKVNYAPEILHVVR
jgi:hypothetical protein